MSRRPLKIQKQLLKKKNSAFCNPGATGEIKNGFIPLMSEMSLAKDRTLLQTLH